ncbi:arginine--tRNA ligase [bacterium]|nr:arginine--tRNA ligase [bacterium]
MDEFIKNSSYPSLNYTINLNKNHDFGDFSTNLCFVYAKQLKKDPKEIAQALITYLIKHYPQTYKNIEFAAPGFVNFYLKSAIDYDLIKKIILQDELYPTYDKNGQKINVEFVSANPTGKLHLAHAYAAIFGQALVNCFIQLGYYVQKEFYINDAGHQIDLLALSVLIRYLNLFGNNIELPEDAYHGEEIIDCANELKAKYHEEFVHTPYTNDGISDEKANETIKFFAKDYMLKQIQLDLKKVDVSFDL